MRLENGQEHFADVVVANASIHHVESKLLGKPHRSFSDRYWQKRTLAPSAFILYLGLRDKVPDLAHHNLIFAQDWKTNFAEIFDAPVWPSDPSLYVCAPSVTDETVAPPGQENLFVLVPVAPGLQATPEQLEKFADVTLQTIEREMNIPNLRERIVYKRMFWGRDFAERYNNFQGTALGPRAHDESDGDFAAQQQKQEIEKLVFCGR